MESFSMNMVINDIKVGRNDTGYIPVALGTNRGLVNCRYYHVAGERKAVIFVGSAQGGYDSPARNLYPKLCNRLSFQNISSLRVEYRYPDDLVESSLDVLAGITFLERFGIKEIALVGHSFGGAVVIQAAAATPEIVRTVVALSTQAHGSEAVRSFQDTSLLLIHGTEDEIYSPYTSTYIHDLASTQKDLLLFNGGSHILDEVSNEVYETVLNWLVERLR